jgi:hypothetical protein
MREQEHNYEVEVVSSGFRIIPRDENRRIVEYILDNDGFWIGMNTHTGIPLYGFRQLIDDTVKDIYFDWKSPKNSEKMGWKAKSKIRTWACKNTGRVLNHRLHEVWLNSLNNINPLVRDIHRKLFSISCGKGNWNYVRDLLQSNNHYLIEDVLNYRAAGISVLWGYDFDENMDWMLKYSSTGRKYTSLNKTLMNLPGNIPAHLILHGLANVYLPEPATTRIRLLAYLMLGGEGRGDEENKYVVLRSSDNEIREAIRLMWNQFPNKNTGTFTKAQGIMSALGLMRDYVGSWSNINIIGLAKRSIEYHRNENLRRELQRQHWERQLLERQQEMERIKESDTTKPKLKLPDDECIKFLSSYKEVVKEGELMHHCIGSYAERAVKGDSYLFHIDYKGQQASVEVNPKGYVQQAYGPYNVKNLATEYGSRVLNDWAKGL